MEHILNEKLMLLSLKVFENVQCIPPLVREIEDSTKLIFRVPNKF